MGWEGRGEAEGEVVRRRFGVGGGLCILSFWWEFPCVRVVLYISLKQHESVAFFFNTQPGD